MHHLKVPLVFAGFGIYCHDRVAEQIGPLAVRAVVIARRAAEGHVDDVASFVGGHGEAPVVHTGAIPPVVALPGFVAWLTGTRHRMKLPELRAGADVIGAGIAGRARSGLLLHVRADEERVLVYGGRGIVGHAEVDDAFVAEARDNCARPRIQRDHFRAGGEDDARGRVFAAGQKVTPRREGMSLGW